MSKLTLKLLSLSCLGPALFWSAAAGSAKHPDQAFMFSHRLHIEDVGLECGTCHEKAAESKSGLEDLLPQKAVCLQCHEAADTTKFRGKPEESLALEKITTYRPKFNHSVHIERKVDCETCHAGIAKSDSAATRHLPVMALCMSCHDDIHALRECITCHENPRGKLPDNHLLPLWKKQHGDDARLDNGQSCTLCHERNDCQECHQGDNLGVRAHPPGYELKHSLEARSGRTECVACHEDRAFCWECHTERHVYPLSHQRTGWAGTQIAGGGRHAAQARINIEACAACHSDEPDRDPVCAACHEL